MSLSIEKQSERLHYWYPALLAGLTTFAAYLVIGQTPMLRAAALSVVIVGISLSMRRLGAPLAYIAGLILGFSPAYWSQTGGPPSVSAWLVLMFIMTAGGLALLMLWWSERVFISFALGISLFVGFYLVFGITQKSLRLTTILSAWTLYMLVIALRQTNPRPEDPPASALSKPHVYGVLLMMTLGILNDPLFVLFIPAVILGLWLSHARLPVWYWLVLFGLSIFGGWGVIREYVSLDWLTHSAAHMHMTETFAPYIVLDGWREPIRWLYLTNLLASQFTWAGLGLGVFGIARMSRWYPTLGVTLMVAFASYGVFGLVYFGKDAEILLLPLLMIQTIWIVYAIYTMIEWSRRAIRKPSATVTAS